MKTIIIKSNGNEAIKSNLKFRCISDGTRYDLFSFEKYAEAKNRLDILKSIFKHSIHEIIVIE